MVLALLALFAIAGSIACRGSSPPAGSDAIDDPALLHPDILLTRTIRRHASGTVSRQTAIRGEIRDARGKAIENRGLDLRVNDVSLPFTVATGNYYDRTPFYSRADSDSDADGDTASVQPQTLYKLSLKLPNGHEAEIGRITTPADLTVTDLDLPLTHPRTQPLTVSWHAAPSSTTLVIRRMVETIGGTAPPPADGVAPPATADIFEQPLNAGTGSFTVPASYFTPLGARATDVIVEFTTTTAASVAAPFRKGSLRAVRESQFIVSLTP